MSKLLEIWKRWSEEGIRWPYLYDPTTSLPSITLALLYVSSLIMFTSLLVLHFKAELLTATLTSIMIWLMSYVMYRIRKLDKFKIDLDDKSIELEGSDEPEGK